MIKTHRFLLAAGVSLAMAFTFSCSSPDDSGGGSVVYGDPVYYGGETYQTVVIGNQTWMARNLNYEPGTGNSACYDNQTSNCAIYGRLYDWSTAMGLPSSCNSSYNDCSSQIQSKHRGICPSGWHIPSSDEWDILVNYAGGETAGTELKATTGWDNNGNGTNKYGFSALPGGYSFFSDGYFFNAGYYGGWWSSSESYYFGDNAVGRSMDYDDERADWYNFSRSYLYSVRCVQD